MISIIAGKYKNRKLKEFKNNNSVRPTKARVRKSIFQILEPIKGKKVLDLYSGVGTLGIEAVSREAESVIMVENSPTIFTILKQNVETICPEENIEIVFSNVNKFLQQNKKFYNLIFADPPYGLIDFGELKLRIQPSLAKNGIFCMEIKKKSISDNTVRIKNYGSTQVLFWKNCS